MPETRDPDAPPRLDLVGAGAITLGLAGVVFALIEGPELGFSSPGIVTSGVVGVLFLAAFLFVERRESHPMVPLQIFRDPQFVGANLTTFLVYAAVGGAMVFVTIELQAVMGHSALEAGASFAPATLLLLTLSSRAGRIADRIGPRLPMTIGPLVAAVGFALLTRLGPGASYLGEVLPGVIAFGLGLSITVAPLTAAVLASIDPRRAGVGSAVNNAVSRIAGLLAVTLLPLVAGFAGTEAGSGAAFAEGFARVMWTGVALCVAGGVTAFLSIRSRVRVETTAHPSFDLACHDPALCSREPEPATAGVAAGP